MPDSIQQLAHEKFQTNLEIALQQSKSKFEDKVMSGSHRGETVSVKDDVSAIEMRPVTGPFQEMGRIENDFSRRGLAPSFWDLPQYVDSTEKLLTDIEVNGALVRNATAALNRRKDKLILAGMFGANIIGKDLNQSELWSTYTGQVVGVGVGSASGGTPTGFNVQKILEAIRILEENDVDLESEELFIGVNSKAHSQLMQEAQAISMDYVTKSAMELGRINAFLGATIVRSQLFEVDGSGYRRLPVWTKSSMHYGTWDAPSTVINKDITKQNHPWQIYTTLRSNACRLEPKAIVEIKVSEA